MLRIAVCDDNRPMLDYLCDKTHEVLKHNSTDFEITPFLDAEKLLESCRCWKYDIFLLNLSIPAGKQKAPPIGGALCFHTL